MRIHLDQDYNKFNSLNIVNIKGNNNNMDSSINNNNKKKSKTIDLTRKFRIKDLIKTHQLMIDNSPVHGFKRIKRGYKRKGRDAVMAEMVEIRNGLLRQHYPNLFNG